MSTTKEPVIHTSKEEEMEMPTMVIAGQLKESISRSSASGSMLKVEFSLYAPDANKVYIAGQFNDWDTKSLPMKKSRDGSWRITLKLPRGKCEYKYFVDGAWAQDIACAETVPNAFGTANCMITV